MLHLSRLHRWGQGTRKRGDGLPGNSLWHRKYGTEHAIHKIECLTFSCFPSDQKLSELCPALGLRFLRACTPTLLNSDISLRSKQGLRSPLPLSRLRWSSIPDLPQKNSKFWTPSKSPIVQTSCLSPTRISGVAVPNSE